ncbi:hypothetical protein HDV06_005652 [Boothiomyces sp. JEL0866]|nr:hypothetical protein HDV06_005652 [Boothiomyces sp. JEL0866]
MAGGIVAAFDPTAVDAKERERLPPLASHVELHIRQAHSRQTPGHIIPKKKSTPQSQKLANKLGSDQFPKLNIILSDQKKQILKTNPTARFLMTLHESSLEHKRRQDQLQEKRNMTVNQAYDWVIVKQISQEYQFLKYIENLKQKGQLILEQLHDEDRLLIGHLAESIITQEDSKQGPEEMISINQNKAAKAAITTEKGLALIKEFLENIKSYMRSSPFRPKLKGQTAMIRHFPDREKDYVFGKPPKFTEEMAMEFNRTFGEIESLSANVQFKLSAIEADSELFEIAPTIAAAIEAMQGNAKILGKSDKKLDTPKNKESIVEGVAEILKKEFTADQHSMQKQLLKYLRLRSNERLQKSLHIDTMVQTQNLATHRVDRFIESSKLIPTTPKSAPNLWMYGKIAGNIPFEFSKIGITDNISPVLNTHGYHRDRPQPVAQDTKLNLSKIDSQSRLDEQMNAIRLMFAQEFGDIAAPPKEAKGISNPDK